MTAMGRRSASRSWFAGACCCGTRFLESRWNTDKMSIWMTAATSLVAAIIGGVISPQMSQAQERRAARAALRDKIAELDALLWADIPYHEYARAVGVFESAAIMARIPRPVARQFVMVHTDMRVYAAAQRGARDDVDSGMAVTDDPETVEWALEHWTTELSVALYHPWRYRLSRQRRLRLLRFDP